MPFLRPGPPPEVCVEIDEAWERTQRPFPAGVELWFESVPGERRAWGVLRVADGTQIERITATEAVAFACGDAEMRSVRGLAV
jgi:hypothetical protein